MNQILFTQDDRETANKTDINKIIVFFCVFLLLFGIVLITSGVINIKQKISKSGLKNPEEPDSYNEQVPQNTISDDEIDEKKPEIKVTVSGNDAKIKVTDETEIYYITYKWNDEEETKVYALQDDKNTIQVSVPILKGQNTLTILAVDKAGNQNQSIKPFLGLTKPVIADPELEYGDQIYLKIKVTDEFGIDYVKYTINGESTYRLVTETPQKEIAYSQPINIGDHIEIYAYNIEGQEDSRKIDVIESET